MPHQTPEILMYLRRHFPHVDWVSLSQHLVTVPVIARHIAMTHDLTLKEAQEAVQDAILFARRPKAATQAA